MDFNGLFIIDLPIENGDVPMFHNAYHSYICLQDGMRYSIQRVWDIEYSNIGSRTISIVYILCEKNNIEWIYAHICIYIYQKKGNI